MKSIAIVGESGGLAKELILKLQNSYQVRSFGKDQYNYVNSNDVDALAKEIAKFDIIINCPGVFDTDSWDTFLINCVAPAKLIEQLVTHNSRSHVILIGSHAATWTSWPNINLKRLWYNISKETLESIVLGVNHSGATNLKFTLFNVSRFQTAMGNFSGNKVEEVVSIIEDIIVSTNPPLIYELPSPDA